MKNAWKFLAGCGCLSLFAGAVMIGLAFFWFRAPETAKYVNSREGRTGNLAENYVDFSFDYAKSWTVKTADPDNINFVTVERRVNDQTWENLNVGYFNSSAAEAENQAVYAQVLGQIENQFAQQFRDFHKVSDGPTKVGPYDGHTALYEGWVDSNGTHINVYIRAIFIPRPGGGKGVSMMMIGTSLNPDLKEANDLGTKGELPIALESFRFGSS